MFVIVQGLLSTRLLTQGYSGTGPAAMVISDRAVVVATLSDSPVVVMALTDSSAG